MWAKVLSLRAFSIFIFFWLSYSGAVVILAWQFPALFPPVSWWFQIQRCSVGQIYKQDIFDS